MDEVSIEEDPNLDPKSPKSDHKVSEATRDLLVAIRE